MQANPRKTTSLRHLGKVDIAQLREAVLAIPESVWDAENQNKPNRRYRVGGSGLGARSRPGLEQDAPHHLPLHHQ